MTRHNLAASHKPRRFKVNTSDVGLDCASWLVAILMSALFVTGGRIAMEAWLGLGILALGACLAQLIIGTWLSLYNGRLARGSFPELKALIIAGVMIGAIIILLGFIVTPAFDLPAALLLLAVPLGVGLLCVVRYARRLAWESGARANDDAQRTLVLGAGYLGRHVVRVMLSDQTSQFRPVGFLDDDDALVGTKVDGLPVLGTLSQVEAIARETSASAIVVSIARADHALLRRVSELAEEIGLRVLVFPSLEEVLEGKSRLRDVRDISVEDLIGRKPVDTDVESMAGYLRGKRILVTGAGGSIGSELCRQISKYAPEELIMLDRDETGLQSTQLLLEGHGLLTSNNIVLADIRDAEALDDLFRNRRPTVVFHAAALKHLPMLERFPDEAWKTNVVGTLNVLRAAMAVDVETFVNISTDKAANATSVLGHSKRLAERLTANAAVETGRNYLSVRFGNVLGSRGSLVPVFAAMIEAGGPVTVTDREVTRFFMSISEACHLVVQAGGIGSPGEVLILDMGEPVRIMDIAELMIARSGRDIAIVFTGLRDGEKLHEELVSDGEVVASPVHPKISHSSVNPLAADELDRQSWREIVEGRVS